MYKEAQVAIDGHSSQMFKKNRSECIFLEGTSKGIKKIAFVGGSAKWLLIDRWIDKELEEK